MIGGLRPGGLCPEGRENSPGHPLRRCYGATVRAEGTGPNPDVGSCAESELGVPAGPRQQAWRDRSTVAASQGVLGGSFLLGSSSRRHGRAAARRWQK